MHRALTPQIPNHSILVMHLYFPQIRVGRGITKGISVEELETVERQLAGARSAVDRARPARADAASLGEELRWTIDVMELVTEDAKARLAGDGTLASIPQARRRAFAARLADLTDRHRALWLARNRPGGLADSCAWLDHLRAAYESGEPDPTWGGWPARYS